LFYKRTEIRCCKSSNSPGLLSKIGYHVTCLYIMSEGKMKYQVKVAGKLEQLLAGRYAHLEVPVKFTAQDIREFLFGFDWDKPWKKDYLDKQIDRYLITLDHISGFSEETRVLEIGAMPYGFSLLMRHFLFSDVQASCLDDFAQSGGQNINEVVEEFISRRDNISYELVVKNFNMEKDPWPYNDETLDLVVASEVIEHLTQDPMHVISEANRVLKNNGTLFITTPNLLSLWKLNRMFEGLQPIGDPFYRLDSVYNRHNRELTPAEIRVLYESGGFDVDYIQTLNVKKKNIANPLRFLFIRLLAGRINDRKDIIFAMGVKKGSVRDRYPTTCQLYK